MYGVGMSSVQNYSVLDKILHYMAFATPIIQRTLSDLEDNIYKQDLAKIHSKNEIFITGLPRSGTTLLLELFYNSDEFSSYSYRHMPFILSPLLWRKIAGSFSKESKKVQRAHNDGMEVSYDSPEAFEEVIWLSYLKEHIVQEDCIEPLTSKNTTKLFVKQFKQLINKILLSDNYLDNHKRYISKNNSNCSRLDLLTRIFPSATILVPFRNPLAHIGSLMKQHRQFSDLHKEDKFSLKYMRWIGHYDFGENLKPINFDKWLDTLSEKPDFDDQNFWIQYWCFAYGHILKQSNGNIYLVDFDRLLTNPNEVLASLANKANLKEPADFVLQASDIRAPTSEPIKSNNIDEELLNKANDLYIKLKESAL